MLLVINTLLLPYIVINYAISEICSSRILGDPQSPTGHSLELCWPCLEVGVWVGSPEPQQHHDSTLSFNFLTLSIKASRAAPEGGLTVLQGRSQKENALPQDSHGCFQGFDPAPVWPAQRGSKNSHNQVQLMDIQNTCWECSLNGIISTHWLGKAVGTCNWQKLV